MKIIVENTSEKPLYQQIKDQIKDAILSGDLKEGDLLPSIRALANDLHVSILTTRRVYDELETEGFIMTKAGKGSFVAPGNLELLQETKRHMVEVKLEEAWDIARSFKISRKELIEMMNVICDEEDGE